MAVSDIYGTAPTMADYKRMLAGQLAQERLTISVAERDAFDAWRRSSEGKRWAVRSALQPAIQTAQNHNVDVDEFLAIAAQLFSDLCGPLAKNNKP